MLRGILGRVLGGGRGRRPGGAVRQPSPHTGATGGTTPEREIERGAKSLLRGVGRKKRGL